MTKKVNVPFFIIGLLSMVFCVITILESEKITLDSIGLFALGMFMFGIKIKERK